MQSTCTSRARRQQTVAMRMPELKRFTNPELTRAVATLSGPASSVPDKSVWWSRTAARWRGTSVATCFGSGKTPIRFCWFLWPVTRTCGEEVLVRPWPVGGRTVGQLSRFGFGVAALLPT